MTYYILLKGEPKENLMYDNCILGEITADGKKFYANRGFHKLLKIVDKAPEVLEGAVCYNDNNKEMSIEQFLKEIGKCQIQKQMEE
jgi:hypothetical protein